MLRSTGTAPPTATTSAAPTATLPPRGDAPFASSPDCSTIPVTSSSTRLRSAPGSRESHAIRMSRSEEHTSELQSLMRISYAVFCLKKKNKKQQHTSVKTTKYDKK